jgi:hypothetical protein
MTARKSFLLRISPALYEAIEGWAEQEMRSVNGQIEYVLKEAVRKRDGRFVEDTESSAGGAPQKSSPTPE